MISPTTSSSRGSSCRSAPSRVTVQVVVIMARSFSEALELRRSWTNRRMPEMVTMLRMMMTVMGSNSSGVLPNSENRGKIMSVTVDTRARQNRIAVKGLTKALHS